MVNNPPGFYYHTGFSSIVVPDGDVADLLSAADQFNARWLVLDANRPEQLAALFAQTDTEPRLTLRAVFDLTQSL